MILILIDIVIFSVWSKCLKLSWNEHTFAQQNLFHIMFTLFVGTFFSVTHLWDIANSARKLADGNIKTTNPFFCFSSKVGIGSVLICSYLLFLGTTLLHVDSFSGLTLVVRCIFMNFVLFFLSCSFEVSRLDLSENSLYCLLRYL